MRDRFAIVVGLVALLALTGSAFGAPFSVGATSNIFLAGQPAPIGVGQEANGGTLPVEVTVTGGDILSFSSVFITSVPGQMSCNYTKIGMEGYNVDTADGGPCGYVTSTNITGLSTTGDGLSGISGISAPNTMFLVGVFLTDDAPMGADPATLDFTSIGTDFTSLSPMIGQTFFIGDGLTGSGSGDLQQFVVPAGATRLFLGFADANDGSGRYGAFQGPNGWYGDNFGIFSGDVNVVGSMVPEPATMALMGLGLLGLGFLRRRR